MTKKKPAKKPKKSLLGKALNLLKQDPPKNKLTLMQLNYLDVLEKETQATSDSATFDGAIVIVVNGKQSIVLLKTKDQILRLIQSIRDGEVGLL